MFFGRSNGKTIPPLLSGGLMLSYRCTNTCRHCLYRCSPKQPDEWITMDTARKVLQALSREPRFDGLHLAGGEPTIKMDLLVAIIRLSTEIGVPLSYVETNAFWCRDLETAVEGMSRMREAGLPAILISVSMFHNEFVPFSSTRNAVEAAGEVFGPGGTLVYLPHIYQILQKMPDDGRHDLEEFCRFAGIGPEAVAGLYSVIPGGRAVDALRDSFTARPAKAYRRDTCMADLMSTSHFHIDHKGRLFTGLCAGITPANVSDLHPDISPESHPVFHMLMHKGPCGLMEVAREKHGYEERQEGYVSKCDLCIDVRKCMRKAEAYSELEPASFYEG